jgi:hypothetical protein
MAPKFGNYLFRNLKGQSPDQPVQSAEKQSEALGSLEEQPIQLQAEDLDQTGQGAPSLDWSRIGGGRIHVQLKDTAGILEGRVTVRASVLRGICPALFTESAEKEYLYPVSLKTVVLQIQEHLKRYQRATTKQTDIDFDTPIAQVAREDEGFFRLEESVRLPTEAKPGKVQLAPTSPILTPADRPTFPLIRERALPMEEHAEPRTEAAPLEVSVRPPKSPQPESPPAQEPTFDPFRDLPKVGPEAAKDRVRNEDRSDLPEHQLPSVVQPREKLKPAAFGPPMEAFSMPLRRIGLERLQEIFLTEDLLDAGEVAKRIGALPKVKGVLILFQDKTIIGGALPAGYDAGGAHAVQNVIQSIRAFASQLNSQEVSGITILGGTPISLFAHKSISLVLVHEGRGLLPGMRERMSDAVRALHILYDGLEVDP